MRASKFTFKKTKKIVKKYQAISLDLTVDEADILRGLLRKHPTEFADNLSNLIYNTLAGISP